jgi:hypothetical protein
MKNYKELCRELEKKNKTLSIIFDTWLYGLSKIGGENRDSVKQIQAEAVRHWLFDMLRLKIPKTKDPIKACRFYIGVMDKEGLMKKEAFVFSKQGQKIMCEIKAPCVYNTICKKLLDEGVQPLCLRTQPFITVIEEATGKLFDGELTKINPERACVVELNPQ